MFAAWVLIAAGPARSADIALDQLPRIGKVDERFQSYNVEMAEITGGEFWRPYPPGRAEADGLLFQAFPPLDTANARLRRLAAALGPAYMRISGTWANAAFFHDSDAPAPDQPPRGFRGVLTRSQWQGAIDFARAANAELVISFTVSAGVRDADGLWTADQAERWLEVTRSAGAGIAAVEFFNEPTLPNLAGVPDGYDATAFARDLAVFRGFMQRVAPKIPIAGPDAVGEMTGTGHAGLIATEEMFQARPTPAFDIYAFHHYPALSLRCRAMGADAQTTAEAALSEAWLARAAASARFHLAMRDRYAPGAPVWVTEIADAACGGNPWARTFLDTFRYTDVLGQLARDGVGAVFHNTLAASDYGLLARGTFKPRPNYWAALLWRRLMGSTVLDPGPSREGLHLYAHCLRGVPGGVALLAINNGRTETSEIRLSAAAERYTLSADALEAEDVKLNGRLLQLGADDDLPAMTGEPQPAGTVSFAPASVTFLTMAAARNSGCG